MIRLNMRLLVPLAIITVFAAPVFAVEITLPYENGTLSISADKEISENVKGVVIAKHNVHLKDVNRLTNSTLQVFATTMTVTRFLKPSRDGAVTDIIRFAEFAGPVKIMQTANKTIKDERTGEETTVVTTIEVTADNATYDGVEQTACLSGNVKGIYTDPSELVGPATFIAEEAIINLDPNPGPDDLRFRIRGEPSRLTGTMKNKGT